MTIANLFDRLMRRLGIVDGNGATDPARETPATPAPDAAPSPADADDGASASPSPPEGAADPARETLKPAAVADVAEERDLEVDPHAPPPPTDEADEDLPAAEEAEEEPDVRPGHWRLVIPDEPLDLDYIPEEIPGEIIPLAEARARTLITHPEATGAAGAALATAAETVAPPEAGGDDAAGAEADAAEETSPRLDGAGEPVAPAAAADASPPAPEPAPQAQPPMREDPRAAMGLTLCLRCFGGGEITTPTPCPACHGAREDWCEGISIPCRVCHATGRVNIPCPACEGQGWRRPDADKKAAEGDEARASAGADEPSPADDEAGKPASEPAANGEGDVVTAEATAPGTEAPEAATGEEAGDQTPESRGPA